MSGFNVREAQPLVCFIPRESNGTHRHVIFTFFRRKGRRERGETFVAIQVCFTVAGEDLRAGVGRDDDTAIVVRRRRLWHEFRERVGRKRESHYGVKKRE